MNAAANDGPGVEIVVFEAAGQFFGVRSALVRQIVRAATLSAAPHAHPAIQGILNLRGQVVAVFDVRWLLNAPATPLAPTDHFIVTESAGRWLALRADRAVELAKIPSGSVTPAEGVAPDWRTVAGVAKINDRLVLLIDPAELWSSAGIGAAAESDLQATRP
jgi:two-component system chemotaxis response regulator CheV